MTFLISQLQDALGDTYRIEHELAGGGMSRLYLATELGLNRRVVIKLLPPELTTEMSVARFKREIDVTVKLQHPNILPVLTAGSRGAEILYYITPFIQGESLRARISRGLKPPLDDVVRTLREVGEALTYAHSRGVVHRDVKPENILLTEGHAILADFGIARAFSSSGGGPGSLTGSGAFPGTPAYMAPELPSDERADIYALGVVGYEMLTGSLPPRGRDRSLSAKQIVAARGAVPGDSRPALQRVADVLANALDQAPERRFSTTSEFMTALVDFPQSRPVARWPTATAVAAIVVALTAVGAIAVWRASHAAPSVVDRNPYMVAPFSGADSSLAARMTRRVSDALGEWRGVSVIADQRVRDVLGRASDPPSLESARDIARRLGAHSLVLGEVERVRDSVVIRVSRYAVSDSASTRAARSTYALTGDTNATTAVRRAVNSLVRDGAQSPWRGATDSRQPVLASWTAYDRGRAALDRWDLPGAERAFHEAIAADPRNVNANLWLAQAIVWDSRDSVGELRSIARQALAGRAELAPREARLATAIWALADSQYVDACRGFNEMVKSDSTDLAAWLGLGECRRKDFIVIPAPRSPSGWAFRGSWAAASRAYLRAGDVAPASVDPAFRGWLMKRLGAILYTETNYLRTGRVQGPTRELMYSATFLSGDTIGFAPISVKDMARGKTAVPDYAVDQAVERNLETLRHAAEQWVLRAPRSADAYAGLASLAEATGGFAHLGETRIAALDAARRAQSLSADAGERFRLAIVQARLLVKTEQFAAARTTADSILTVAQRESRGSDELAGLAVLLGRPAQAAALLEANNKEQNVAGRSTVITLPPAVLKEHLRLVAYTALGAPADSVHEIALRAVAAISSYIRNDSIAAEARAGILGRSLSLVFPHEAELLAKVPATDRVIQAEQLSLTNRAAVSPLLRDLIRNSNAHGPAQAMEGPYRMAMVSLAIGDSATAIRVLDRSLGALPTIRERFFIEIPQVAGLLRAMVLRADLAAARHDRATASRWGTAVATLWAKADPEVRPVASRMKSLGSKL